MLDINQSRFVDFQKVRIQETQQELPRGSIPRSLEIVLRAEAVEMVQAGDKCDFIGTLIAIPDVAQLAMESEWLGGRERERERERERGRERGRGEREGERERERKRGGDYL